MEGQQVAYFEGMANFLKNVFLSSYNAIRLKQSFFYHPQVLFIYTIK